MSEFDRDTLLGFVEEVTGYMPAIRGGLAAFRENPTDGSALDEVHRFVHIIKGASAMIGLSGLSHIAFHLEEVIERAVHEPETVTAELLAGFEEGTRYIERYIAGLATGGDQAALVAEGTGHVRRLRGLPSEEAAPPAAGDDLEPPLDFSTQPALPPVDTPDWLTTAADWETLPDFDLATIAEPPPATAPETPAVSPELLEVFRLEADDHLRTLAALLPEARNDPADEGRWGSIRRATHTLKGSAGLVGFDEVTRLAHRMEDLLDLYFESGRTATPEEIDLLLAATDAIEDAVAGREHAAAFAALHVRLGAALAADAPASGGAQAAPLKVAALDVAPAAKPTKPARSAREVAESTVRVPIEKLDEIAKLIGELVIARTTMEQRVGEFARLLGEVRPAGERLSRVSGRLEAGYEARALSGSRAAPAAAWAFAPAGGGEAAEAFDDLELDRYTEFHLLTRELAETTTDVQTVVGELGLLQGDFDGQLTRQARLASELEEKLMRLRMVPLGTVAGKLQRTVRNAAEATGKKAELVIDGERTGLDKTVLEAMADPLLHLLRNAVDHGLESPEVRRALGKPEHGTITLRAAHEGSHVVLTLSDDGRGIDFEQIRSAVARRGLVSPEGAAALSEEDLAEFLFRPRFSTRDEVSEMSGRGVGLDVVRTKVGGLKGSVAVTAAAGRGTTFTVRLPMTLAVVRALLVKVGAETFAIPLEAVEQILRPGDEEIDRVGREPVLRVGGSVCPLVPLARVLRLPEAHDAPPTRRPVVLLRAAGRRVAVAVDQLLGGREVVIKSLGRRLKQVPGVSGATLLGDGSVVLILNPADLTRGAAPAASRPAERGPAAPARQQEALTVLVVDDSPSVRRVLEMLFKGAGWAAITARDGREALEILERAETRPDVVLTDVEMPRMDGYELLTAIRGQAGLSHLPVAMLTSRGADKHRRRALDLGASAYVLKPYQNENLLDVLRQLARADRPTARS